MTGMVGDLQVNRERMRHAASMGFSTATDVADWLVRQANIPFRDAHEITGHVVKLAEQKGIPLDGLTIEDFKLIDHRIDSRIHKVLSVESSVRARRTYGGTAPENVLAQAARWKSTLTGADGRAAGAEGEARRWPWRRRHRVGDGRARPGRCG